MADGNREPTLSVTLARPLLQDFAYLASRLSEDERRQWCAVSGAATYDADAAARNFAACGPLQWVLVGPDSVPLYACGGNEVMPGVLQTWALATEDAWRLHGKTITRVTRRLIDTMLAEGYRRVQTTAHVDRRCAHLWYERGLGMQREGVLRDFNADGSDAVIFSRVKES